MHLQKKYVLTLICFLILLFINILIYSGLKHLDILPTITNIPN